MIEIEKQLEYIRNQLSWIKSKIELDNQLGLYDINKLGENIFMHILNDVYDWNLKNANLIEENFPAIDLVDDTHKIVIQVTSTTTPAKLRTTIEKFKKLEQYSDYKLKMFYIKNKPSLKKTKEEFEQKGVSSEDLLGIDDIINIIQEEPQKCQSLYKTIKQRFDVISFKFNIEFYFEQFEPHLQNITDDKFQRYKEDFKRFIECENKVLEIHSVGGNGKSHLLRYFALTETEYIPLIFTKQINIEEDLKKLDKTKKYLFIVDDIDRFLEQPLLLNLLSYTISNHNIKLILSYRTPSKNAIETIYRKFTHIKRQEIKITWSEDEIKSLILTLIPSMDEHKVLKLSYTFNHNPYLITQAISGDMESIKDFSQKILDDTIRALDDFRLSEKEIKDLLFELSLITPISKNMINKQYKSIINRLVDSGILRELASKYRFNPDMIGDLYLANYIDENKDNFQEIVEQNLSKFSDTVFTNLSYALVYNKSDSLKSFIKRTIQRWIDNGEYKNEYLALINKIVYFAPMESFIYLQKATKNLIPKETNNLPKSDIEELLVTAVQIDKDIYNSDNDAINLKSIEPIVSKLIYALKNNIDTEGLEIKHIVEYLSSDIVLNLPKPYYDNQTLESIFKQIVSPLNTQNFDVILEALTIIENWIEEEYNESKIDILINTIKILLKATFSNTSFDDFTVSFNEHIFNLSNPSIKSLKGKAKDILIEILKSNNKGIIEKALSLIIQIGNGMVSGELSEHENLFYSDMRKEVLTQCKLILETKEDFSLYSQIEDISTWILEHTFEDKEALELLKQIKFTDEYLLYRFVLGKDILCITYDNYHNEYIANKDNYKVFGGNNQFKKRKIFETKDDKYEKISRVVENEKQIIENIKTNYIKEIHYIELLNKLELKEWNSSQNLKDVLNSWIESDVFLNMAQNHLEKINDEGIRNLIKDVLLNKGFKKIDIDNITRDTSNDDLKVYIDVVFTNFDESKLKILEKIVEVVADKKPDDIRMFISIISQRLYFIIADDNSLYHKFEHIILKFLQWQLQDKFDVESYLTHHILYGIAKNNDLKINNEIIEVLKEIINDNEIKINEFELRSIYTILDYGLSECIDILYSKVTSLKENGNPKYIFIHDFDINNISEVRLLKSLVKSYEDFKILIDKVWNLYARPVSFIGADGNTYEDYVNLDYFFKHIVSTVYIDRFFSELYDKKEVDKIKLFYKIVPVSFENIDIIVNNLNLLDGIVSENELLNYLQGVGKMKMYSGSHMQNSPELLKEEKLFEDIKNRIDSLSLQLKLKDILKSIEIEKREEIERDISRLLDK